MRSDGVMVWESVRIAVVLLPLAYLVACDTPPPGLIAEDGSEAVRVVQLDEVFESDDCTEMGTFLVRDGRMGSGRDDFHGTEERATILVKNEALRRGADTAVVNDVRGSVVSEDSSGSITSISGTLYKCRPN